MTFSCFTFILKVGKKEAAQYCEDCTQHGNRLLYPNRQTYPTLCTFMTLIQYTGALMDSSVERIYCGSSKDSFFDKIDVKGIIRGANTRIKQKNGIRCTA